MTHARRLGVAVVLLVVPALGACNRRSTDASGPPAKLADNAMLELADVYKYIRDSKLPSPKKLQDLDDYEASLPTAYSKIQSGEYVVLWGAGLSGGNAVLAHEKDVAAKGGIVLLQNGEVKSVTAAEFSSLGKAR